MLFKENVSLAHFNTFGFESDARFFVEVASIEDMQQVAADLRWHHIPLLVLGGGSNILLTGPLNGLVMKVISKGIKLVKEDTDFHYLEVQAGEVWDDFVQYCVGKNYGGVENLSLIPGTVGAAPMQNIGAYGAEIKQIFDHLVAVERITGNIRRFSFEECQFGYRESIFKTELKDRYIISSVTFKLPKNHPLSIEYGDIRKTLDTMGVTRPDIKSVREAVISIRRSKLPDPAQIGNSGSFFKNPVIGEGDYYDLKKRFSEVPGYPAGQGKMKIAAGWLIEKAGWKGYREGHVGVHDRQALVLVHYGNGQGSEILALSDKISNSVLKQFGIALVPEVNILV